MRRDVLKRLERAFRPEKVFCIHVEQGKRTREFIYCDHLKREIPTVDCPEYRGEKCDHTRNFKIIKLVRVEAGPNGELIEIDFEDEEDDEAG